MANNEQKKNSNLNSNKKVEQVETYLPLLFAAIALPKTSCWLASVGSCGSSYECALLEDSPIISYCPIFNKHFT